MPCADCNFYQPIQSQMYLPANRPFGECRRVAPSVIGTPDSRDRQTLAMFPVVNDSDWCGEFVPWPAPLGQRAEDECNAAFDAASQQDASGAAVADNSQQRRDRYSIRNTPSVIN